MALLFNVLNLLFCFALFVFLRFSRRHRVVGSLKSLAKGGFLLSRNFHVRTQVNSARLNKIEAMFGRSRVIVKVESRPTHVYVIEGTICTIWSSGNWQKKGLRCC